MNEGTPGLFILSSGVQYGDVSINASSGKLNPHKDASQEQDCKEATRAVLNIDPKAQAYLGLF